MFRFEKLEVWQKAVEYADAVHAAARKSPDVERFGLTSQMRRAAVCVSSNVAEGSARSSDSESSRFVEIGYGSLMETVSRSHVAKRQACLDANDFDSLTGRADQLARVPSGLRARLLKH